MAALPYMQLYVADYLADTAHLTATEHGAYLLLMFNYWQRGESFKAKDQQSLSKRLATVARLSSDEWEEVRETISDFFEVTDTEWSHRRIDRDLGVLARRPSATAWAKIRAFIFERDDYTCRYCGKRGVKLECDHVIPVSRGGDSHPGNLATACFSCNRSKRNKLLSEWRTVNG